MSVSSIERDWAGADAILLIARIVSPTRLGELYQAARARKLEPVVEVVTEAELASALACDARVIGVNARDLDTLAMDASHAARLLDAIPSTAVRIHLSGIKSDDDVRAVARRPVDAVLMGEFLMREQIPSSACVRSSPPPPAKNSRPDRVPRDTAHRGPRWLD